MIPCQCINEVATHISQDGPERRRPTAVTERETHLKQCGYILWLAPLAQLSFPTTSAKSLVWFVSLASQDWARSDIKKLFYLIKLILVFDLSSCMHYLPMLNSQKIVKCLNGCPAYLKSVTNTFFKNLAHVIFIDHDIVLIYARDSERETKLFFEQMIAVSWEEHTLTIYKKILFSAFILIKLTTYI